MPFSAKFFQLINARDADRRLRIAPTPSGFLHLGNGINFVLNWLVARQNNANRLLLRIDDMDAERKRPAYIADIFETLDWLGLDWDEGPTGPDDFEKNWSQIHRKDLYINILDQLRARTDIYATQLSRKELLTVAGGNPGVSREQHLPLNTPDASWRIATPEGFPLPDFVVRRRDGLPAYQITSLADDLYFGVSNAIRGVDLHPSSAAQLWLLQVLGWDELIKIDFLHHPLILDETGQKQSKSAGSAALQSWRDAGKGPQHVFMAVAKMLDLPETYFETAEALLKALPPPTTKF